jgi:hypothetical protein
MDERKRRSRLATTRYVSQDSDEGISLHGPHQVKKRSKANLNARRRLGQSNVEDPHLRHPEHSRLLERYQRLSSQDDYILGHAGVPGGHAGYGR